MADYMKAVAVTSRNTVSIVDDVPIPIVGPYDALVKIHSCGFCNGTDFHVIDGSLTKNEGMGDYPTLLGHEGCGDIVELGEKVKRLKIGERFVRPHIPTGGKYSLTFGNMTEYGIVVDHQAMLEDGYKEEDLPYNGSKLIGSGPNFKKIPNTINPVDGGVIVSLCECYSSVKDFGIGQGDSVLVYGCGPMGLASMHVMKALGAKRIVAIDSIEDRLETARTKIMVEKTVNFQQQDIEKELGGEEFDFVYDAVGSVDILEKGSRFLKYGGKICGLGVISEGRGLLNLHRVKNNTAVHVHMQPYRRFDVMDEVVALIEAGELIPSDFYSHVIPMEDIAQAIELVKAKKCLKVILQTD